MAAVRPNCTVARQKRLLVLCLRFAMVTGCYDFTALRLEDAIQYINEVLAHGESVHTASSNLKELQRLSLAIGCDISDTVRLAMRVLPECNAAARATAGWQPTGRVWRLLNDKGFIALKDSSLAGARAAYWMVLLSLFTSLTSAQLANLEVTDIAWVSHLGYLFQLPAGGGRGSPERPAVENSLGECASAPPICGRRSFNIMVPWVIGSVLVMRITGVTVPTALQPLNG